MRGTRKGAKEANEERKDDEVGERVESERDGQVRVVSMQGQARLSTGGVLDDEGIGDADGVGGDAEVGILGCEELEELDAPLLEPREHLRHGAHLDVGRRHGVVPRRAPAAVRRRHATTPPNSTSERAKARRRTGCQRIQLEMAKPCSRWARCTENLEKNLICQVFLRFFRATFCENISGGLADRSGLFVLFLSWFKTGNQRNWN